MSQLKSRLLKEERRRQKNSGGHSSRLRNVALVGLLLLGCLAALYWIKQDDLDRYRYRQAEDLARQGHYAAAVEDLDRLVASEPQAELTARALLLTGQLLELNLQQYQQGLLRYLELVRDYPQSPQSPIAQRRAADIYKQRLGDYSSALTLLQRLVDSGGAADADQLRYQIGDSYFLLNNYEQARIEFESLLKLYPDSPLLPDVQYRIGMAYWLNGQIEQAAEAFAEGMRRWPDDRFSLESEFALAAVYEQRDELRKALKGLRKLEGRYPEEAILQHRIDRVKKRMAKKKKAI